MKCEHKGFRNPQDPYQCGQCGKGIGKGRVCECGASLLNATLLMTGGNFSLLCSRCKRESMLYEPETLDITSFVVMDIETTGLATQPIVIEHPDGAKFTYRHEIIEVFAAHETPSENVPFDQLRTFHRVYETGLPRELVFEGSRWIFDYTGEFGERGALVEDFVRWFPASAAGNWTVAGRNIQDFDFRFLNDTIEGWKEHVRPSGFLDCASFFSGAEHRGKRISLNECVSESGLLRSFGVHSAMSDVWDTIRVIRKQLGVPATQPELTS